MIDISKPINIVVEGRGKIRLTPTEHVTTGGEGHVFHTDSLAVKLWADPDRAASDHMIDRLPALLKLKHPSIVAPTALVKDLKDQVIGYAMPWVSGWALPLAFTNDWRRQHQFADDDAAKFVAIMREVLLYTHSLNVLMGDPNELNILGLKDRPSYIDVDSWLPPGFSSTQDKVLPTIRDYHHRAFTREADRFGFAVVSFALFTGIHPYLGVHPAFKRTNNQDKDLMLRMQANASVFDKDVKLNAAVRAFSCIPAALLTWYEAVFKHGNRDAPPDLTGVPIPKAAMHTKMVIAAGGSLTVTKVFTLQAKFVREVSTNIIQCDNGDLVSLARPFGNTFGHAAMDVNVVNQFSDGLFLAAVVDGHLTGGALTFSQTVRMVSCGIDVSRLWVAANRIFSITPPGLDEMSVFTLKDGKTLLFNKRWSINSNSTIFGDGAAVYTAISASFLVVPQISGSVALLRVPELDGMKPLAIFGRERIALLVMATPQGHYKRVLVHLESTLDRYAIAITDTDHANLNVAVTATGIVLRITSEDRLEITVPVKSLTPLAPIDLKNANDGRLIAGSEGVFWISGETIYKVSM